MATERLALILETLGGDKAVGDIKKVTTAVGGIAESAGVSTNSLKNLSVAGTSLGSVMSNAVVVGVVGATAAVAGFAATSAKSFVDSTAAVREFQRASGASAEDASKLVFAMGELGISSETGSRAIFMLGKNLEINTQKLAGFGVVAAKGADGTTDLAATLLNVVGAYGRTTDAGQRAALVTAAFGRSGLELLPILAKGKDGIAELFDEAQRTGHVFSPEDLNTGREFSIAMKELKADLESVGLAVGRLVVPAFTDFIHIIDNGVLGMKDFAGALSHIPGINTVLEGAGVVASALGDAVSWLSGNDDKQATSAEANAAANQDAADAVNARTAATDALNKAVFGAADADKAVTDAGHSVAKAQQDYDDLLKKTAVDTDKVAAAQKSLDEATRSVGHAQREQADAQKAFDEASKAAGILGTDTAAEKKHDAANKLADANDNVASALDRQKAAQADLAKEKAGDPDYQQKLADAKQKVTDATQSLSEKEYAAIVAHDKEKTALEGNSDAATQLLADLKALVAFHPNLMAALTPEIALLSSLGPVVAGWKPLPAGVAGPPTPILGVGLGGAAGPPVPIMPPAPIVHPPGFIGPLGPGETRAAGPAAPTNITINTTNETNPLHVARQVAWQLN